MDSILAILGSVSLFRSYAFLSNMVFKKLNELSIGIFCYVVVFESPIFMAYYVNQIFVNLPIYFLFIGIDK